MLPLTDCGLPPVDLRGQAGDAELRPPCHPVGLVGQAEPAFKRESDAMLRTLASLGGMIALAACATDGGGVSARLEPGAGSALTGDPIFRLSDIAGKEVADLDALLGAPDLTRSEGEGEFRRYSLAGCALLVILYPDEKGSRRAASVTAGALNSGEGKPDLDLCLARGKAK